MQLIVGPSKGNVLLGHSRIGQCRRSPAEGNFFVTDADRLTLVRAGDAPDLNRRVDILSIARRVTNSCLIPHRALPV
jgi:hypothetical protein